MGHVTHHAIVVTTWDERRASEAHAVALGLGLTVTPGPTQSDVNGYRSFLVVPDGSKTGWDEDERGDQGRARFKDWLREQRDADGGSCFEWVEVSFGRDDAYGNDDPPTITDHEWAGLSGEEPGR